jgi:hypothetical protein
MRALLAVAAAGEAVTGFALLAYPPIVVRLLLGVEIAGAGILMSRVAGMGLIGLGVACWPNGSTRRPLHGMLTYGTLVTLYLVYLGVRGEGVGLLLWPAVAGHAILIILLLRARSWEGTRSVGGRGA